MSLATLVQSLEEYAESCEAEFVAADPADLSPDTAAIVLAAVRDCRAGLATLYDEVEKVLLAMAGEKQFTVEGVGVVEIKKSTRRTQWENDELMKRVVARALDERKLDEETGEYESEGAAVARVVAACARPSWRVTALRALGLDPDEYCHVEQDGWSVKLPSRDAV